MNIFYDIETITGPTAEQIFADKKYLPDSRLRDPIKIAASIEEKRASDYQKAALHWTTGQIVCIGAKAGDDIFLEAGRDEKRILDDFYEWVSVKVGSVLIGKHNRKFDDGYLIGRCMVNRSGIPRSIQIDLNKIRDVNDIFGYGTHPQHASLGNYGIALGIGGKSGKGSDVYMLADEDDWEGMKNYCIRDVDLTQEIYSIYEECCNVR